MGHNAGPPLDGGQGDDQLIGGADDDTLGTDTPEENPWARRGGETLEEFRFRIAKELEDRNPDPAKLEELEAAFLDGITQEPDIFLLMQGTTPDQLAGMEPETDPAVIQGMLDAAEANGGLPPIGTGASMAYVIGPDGTVYRRGTEGVDRASLGLMGTLNEIRNQHIAATGKKHADAGDTGALINHALDQGAIDPVSGTLAIGAFAGALGRNVGITFAPQDKPGGGYHSGGASAKSHRAYFPDKGGYQKFQEIKKRGYPNGYESVEQANAANTAMTDQLKGAGFDDAWVAVRGSAVTGKSFKEGSGLYSGHKFDQGIDPATGKVKPSDIDYAVVSSKLHAKAQAMFEDEVTGGGWIGPLRGDQLNALGLEGLVPKRPDGKKSDRSIMIYADRQQLQGRGPWMTLGE